MEKIRTVYVVEVYSARHGGLVARPKFATADEAHAYCDTFMDDDDHIIDWLGQRPADTW